MPTYPEAIKTNKMILSPDNTPILDIDEFTSQYPNHDYAIYFDSNGKWIILNHPDNHKRFDVKLETCKVEMFDFAIGETHPLFISMEQAKANEKFYNDVESRIPIDYIWQLTKPEDVKSTIITIDGKTRKVIK